MGNLMTEFLEKISECAMKDDTGGMVSLLESERPRDDNWAEVLEIRLRAPSTTKEQKERLKVLRKAWREEVKNDLSTIYCSIDIINKIYELEEENEDFSDPQIHDWLMSLRSIKLIMEKLDYLPEILFTLSNLESLELSYLTAKAKKAKLEFPKSFKQLSSLKLLNLSNNGLTQIPGLPQGLEILVLDDNPLASLNLSGLNNLKILTLTGVNIVPTGINSLTALENLIWKNSKLEQFPVEFLELPLLTAKNIDLENSKMNLPTQRFEYTKRHQDFDILAKKVVSYYDVIEKQDSIDDDYFDYVKPATENDIEKLEKTFLCVIPARLKEFYLAFGGFSLGDEILLHTPSSLLEDHSRGSSGWGDSIRSMGLIDMILWSWGNDRPEFGEGDHFSADQITALNQRYLCFGWWHDSWGIEAGHYLFADKEGGYGEIYYHQDVFFDTADELKRMITCKSHTMTFDDLVVPALDKIIDRIVEED